MHRADALPRPMVRLLTWARADELDLAGTAARLDPAARDRLDTASASAAHRFLFGRALLVRTVCEALGTDPWQIAVTATCPDCGLAHGRPLVRAGDRTVHASVSHTADASAVAVSIEHPVGIDVERLDAARFTGIEAIALSPAERGQWRRLPERRRLRSLAEHWTVKEAVAKALGTGLRTDPATIDVGPLTAGHVTETAGHRFLLDHPEPLPGSVVATALLLP
jgi:4'-phosphopantetheinyl transferase